jgi:hypothetical protein
MSDAHSGSIIPEDIIGQDAWDDVVTALHVTDDEIDELLYGEGRSVEDRLARLKEIAGQLRTYEPADLGGDTRVLLGQIDEAIDRLSGGLARDPELERDAPTLDDDPLSHRELLSPDSDELDEIEDEDDESLDDDAGPLPDDETDQAVWADDDSGFDNPKR